jgi:hypothetical protein
MNAWQGYTSNPNMMAGGPQGYMNPASAMNMQNMYGGNGSSTWSSPYAPMYDNPFTASFMMDRTNMLSKPAGAHAQEFRAHMENIQRGATSALASTGMEIGGGFAGSAAGALLGSALLPGIGTIIGGIAGSMAGGSMGGALGEMYSNRVGRQLETHRSLMGLANNNSPYGGGFGYSVDDANKIYGKMEEGAIEDPYFSVGEVTRIMDEGIKSGNIKGGQGVGDITSKIKGLKEVAKSLVEIFGGSDIGEIMDTLRRLNSAGLSNGAAVEASHAVGSVARKYGMDATNLMGNLLQEGEVSSSSGSPFSAIDSAMFKVDMMELVKLDPELAKKLGNNEEQKAAFANVEEAYTALASGQAGTLATGMNIASSENVYGMLAVGTAYSKAGGQEAFDKLNYDEQSKLVSESFSEVKNDHLSGRKTLSEMIQARIADGSFTPVDAVDIYNSNQQAMKKFAGAHSRVLHENKDYGATETMARFAMSVMKNPELKTAAMRSLDTKDRAIMYALADGMDKVQDSREKTKKDLQRSAAIDSGSFEKQWQGGLTAVNKLFGDFIDGLLKDVKKLTSGSIKPSDISASVAAAATGKGGNSIEFAKIHAGMNKRAGAGFEEMTGTGDRDASWLNYLPGFSKAYSPERKVLQSMSTRAGLSRQDVRSGVLGAFSAVGWDSLTEAVGALGYSVMDHEEVASIAKSGNQTKRSQANIRSQNLSAFTDFKEGKIDFATFEKRTRKSDEGLSDSLDSFIEFAKKEDLADAPRALNTRKEFKPLRDSGMLSFYETADLERNENDGAEGYRKSMRQAYSAAFNDGQPEALTAKSEQHLEAMRGIMQISMKAKKSVVSAVGAADTIDYTALKSSISEKGVDEGVKSFISNDSKLNSLDDQTKGFLTTALKYSGGDKSKAMDALSVSYDKAEALMFSGQDGKSLATVLNVGYSGNGTKQEFQNLSDALRHSSSNGIYRNIMKSLNIGEHEAKALAGDLATVSKDNADSMAINDVADEAWVSTLYKKTTEGTDDPLGKAILLNEDAAKATIKWTELKDPDTRKKVFEAAQHISRVMKHTKDSKIADQAKANQTRRQYSGLTDEQFQMAKDMGSVKELGEMDGGVNNFVKTAVGTVAISTSNQVNRGLFGENLNTAEKQASAMGIMGLFRVDKDNGLTRLTSSEIKAKYEDIGEKKYEEQTYTERALTKAMNNIVGETGLKKEDVTGDQLLRQTFIDSGRSHMTAKTLEDSSRSKGQSPVVSVLNEINSKMSSLVTNTAKKDQKHDTSGITPHDYKMGGVTSTYDNSIKPMKDPSVTPVTDPKVAPVAKPDQKHVTPVAKPAPAEKPEPVQPQQKIDIKTKAKLEPVSEKSHPPKAEIPASTKPVTVVDVSKPSKATDSHVGKDRINMSDIHGVPKGSVLTTKSSSLAGVKDDTKEMMIRAKNVFAENKMNMVVTSATDDGDSVGAPRKKNSRHKVGKAFDVSTRQFKDADEARAFGIQLQKKLQSRYGGGVRVHGEKDHMHISLHDKKSDGGYSEDKDAYTAKTFGIGRDIKTVQVTKLDVNKPNLDKAEEFLKTASGSKDSHTVSTRKEMDEAVEKAKEKHAKTNAQLMKDFKAGKFKHDKPFGTKLPNGNYRIYNGKHLKHNRGLQAADAQEPKEDVAKHEAAKAKMRASMIVSESPMPTIDGSKKVSGDGEPTVKIVDGANGRSVFDVSVISGDKMTNEEKKAKTMKDARVAVASLLVDSENGESSYTQEKWNRELKALDKGLNSLYGLDDEGKNKVGSHENGIEISHVKKGTKLVSVDAKNVGLHPVHSDSQTKEDLALDEHRAKAKKIFNDNVTMTDMPDTAISKPVHADHDVAFAKAKSGNESSTVSKDTINDIEKHHDKFSKKLNASSKVFDDHHIAFDRINKITSDTGGIKTKDKENSKDTTISLLERIAVAAEGARDALSAPGPTIKK